MKEIYCQDKAISLLQRAYFADRIAHCYIFAGPQGVGKETTARKWSKLLLCENPTIDKSNDSDFAQSCNICQSCKAFDTETHPDFNKVYKELITFTKNGKGRKTPIDLPIDVIREFMIEKIATRPMLSDSTVYLVCEAEKLNSTSQNALLKILEEPPEFCFIILLCTRFQKLLPTIKSRSQIIRFGAIDEEKIIDKLKSLGTKSDEAKYWTRFSQGSMGTAIKWAGVKETGPNCYSIKKEILLKLINLELAEVADTAEWIGTCAKQIAEAWATDDKSSSKSDITRQAQKGLIRTVTEILADTMKTKTGLIESITNSDQQSDISRLADKLDPLTAAQRVANCYKSLQWVDAGVNEKLIFEQLLLNYLGYDRMRF